MSQTTVPGGDYEAFNGKSNTREVCTDSSSDQVVPPANSTLRNKNMFESRAPIVKKCRAINVGDTPRATLDWHKEILFGLFLMCDEIELSWIVEQTKTDLTKQSNDANEVGGTLSGMMTLPPLDTSVNPSFFTLIPEVLRGIHLSQSSLNKRRRCNTIIEVPPSLRREGHAFFGIEEVEKEAWTKFQSSHFAPMEVVSKINQIGFSVASAAQTAHSGALQAEPDTSHPNCGSVTLPVKMFKKTFKEKRQLDRRRKKRHRKTQPRFEPLSLLYNECSLAAISKWAAKEGRTDKESEDVKKRKKKASVDSKFFFHPVPAPLFRKCLICGGFGHYDIECEKIAEDNVLRLAPATKAQRTLRTFVEEENLLQENNDKAHRGSSKYSSVGIENYKPAHSSTLESVPFEPSSPTMKRWPLHEDVVGEGGAHVHRPGSPVSSDEEYLIKSTACELCGTGFRSEDLLLCDGCDGLFHFQCLEPPLDSVPEGDWFCGKCSGYDSDVSSVVEIEGCEGYVIEQRKRSMAEEEAHETGKNMGVGFNDSSWNAAISILNDGAGRRDSTNEGDESKECLGSSVQSDGDIEVISEDMEVPELSSGELCWAKRGSAPKGKLGRDEWWPALVILKKDPRSSVTVRDRLQTPYVVKLFSLSGAGRVRASDVLPFFQHYEELGQKRLSDRDSPGYDIFRKALEEATAEAGLKTLGQALKKAREIASGVGATKSSVSAYPRKREKMKTSFAKKIPPESEKGQCSARPVGWEDADVAEEDGVLILARCDDQKPEARARVDLEIPQDSAATSPEESHLLSDEADGVIDPESKELKSDSAPSGSTARHLGNSGNSINDEAATLFRSCLVPTKSFIGGIVSWRESVPLGADVDRDTPLSSEARVHFGIVVAANAFCQRALVCSIPKLSNSSPLASVARFQDQLSEAACTPAIYCCSLGPSFWLPFSLLWYVAPAPSSRALAAFEIGLDTALKRERSYISSRKRLEAIEREENMVELPSVDQQLTPPRGDFAGIVVGAERRSRATSKRRARGKIQSDHHVLDLSNSMYASEIEDPGSLTSRSAANGSKCIKRSLSDGIYHAERILDERKGSGGRGKEYLIKWRGFGLQDATWEPEPNILNHNFIKIYKVKKLAEKLKLTGEAGDPRSTTSFMIKALETGLSRLSNGDSTASRSSNTNCACPFCGIRLKDRIGLGGHVKKHYSEPNYHLIREAAKISEDCWINAGP